MPSARGCERFFNVSLALRFQKNDELKQAYTWRSFVFLGLLMSCRSWMLVGLWLVLVVLTILAGLLSYGRVSLLIPLPLIAYGLQGFVSEWLGVAASRAGLSAPNRLLGRFPLLTVGRLNFRRGAFDRIDRYGPKAIAIFSGGSPTVVDFPDADARRKFLAYCRGAYPEAKISS